MAVYSLQLPVAILWATLTTHENLGGSYRNVVAISILVDSIPHHSCSVYYLLGCKMWMAVALFSHWDSRISVCDIGLVLGKRSDTWTNGRSQSIISPFFNGGIGSIQ